VAALVAVTTIALGLRLHAVSGMLGHGVPWSHLAALAILMSLPGVLLFVLLRHYLMRGLLLGAVE
jgi:ABC-type glycerol-3-phosphate transport system permease component